MSYSPSDFPMPIIIANQPEASNLSVFDTNFNSVSSHLANVANVASASTNVASSYNQANAAYAQANAAYSRANSVYNASNVVYGQANAAYAQANAAYNSSNTISIAAYNQANSAYAQANAAYAAANAGGGGGANTGDITFSGIVMQGKYGEAAIAPDETYTSGGQYFRFRAGDDPSHLHFDTNNYSAFDLFLGDDNKYVKLAKEGNVSIQARDTNTGVSNNWSFNPDGSLNGTGSNTIISTDSYSWTFDNTGVMTLPSVGGIITQNSYDSQNVISATYADTNWAFGFSSDNSSNFYSQVKFYGDGSATRGFLVNDTASANRWLFDGQGILTFPDGAIIAQSGLYAANGSNAVLGQFDGNTQIYTQQSGFGVQTYNDYDGQTHTWTFYQNGNLIFPNQSQIQLDANSTYLTAVTQDGAAALFANTGTTGFFVKEYDHNGAFAFTTQHENNWVKAGFHAGNLSLLLWDGTEQTTAYTATYDVKTPSSSTDTGVKGDIVYDDNYIYICVATNSWIRAARVSW